VDAEKVSSSPEAYKWLETPDALLGLGSDAVTMTLAAMGSPNRVKERPWIPLAMAVKVALDAVLASYLLLLQALKLRTLSLWSLLISAMTFARVPLVIPEARAALRQLRGR
jgi:hypothetical protein